MTRRMRHLGVLVLVTAALCGPLAAKPARAAIFIDVGNIKLLPDTPGQAVQIHVTTDAADFIGGCNFNAQIGDGGSAFGGTDAPTITGVDLISGTIFDGNNRGQTDVGSGPQLATYTIVTGSGTVKADGLLATLTIDTTGYTTLGQTWALDLGQTLNGPTDFAPTAAIISDGTITLVPEPGVFAILAVGCLLLMIRRRRHRPAPAH